MHKQEYPDEGQLKDGLWDAIMITGSACNAYDDLPWISKLTEYTRHIAKDHPLVRIIGVCFGHQIVGRAFGAEVRLNPKGWELGVYDIELTEDGREILLWDEYDQMAEETQEGKKYVRLQQVHRDEVAELPPPFEREEFLNLGFTERSPVQILALKYPTEAPPIPSTAGTSAFIPFDVSDSTISSSGASPLRALHILTTQGHPEFDAGIVELIMGVRSEMGVVEGELLKEGQERAPKPHDGLKVGAYFLAMLGYEEAKDEGGTHF